MHPITLQPRCTSLLGECVNYCLKFSLGMSGKRQLCNDSVVALHNTIAPMFIHEVHHAHRNR
jgi:hypothetical protein